MKIILFRGRPGSGKTTLTHAYATKTNLPIIRKDDLYDPIARFVPEQLNRNIISHDILYRILESNAHTDATFILDFGFQTPGDFAIIKRWCSNHNVKMKSIVVTCSDEKIWAERFNKRAENPAPNQLITNFEKLKEYYGDLKIAIEEGELLVDTVNAVDEIVDLVSDFLE